MKYQDWFTGELVSECCGEPMYDEMPDRCPNCLDNCCGEPLEQDEHHLERDNFITRGIKDE
jgi:hypothetical protein